MNQTIKQMMVMLFSVIFLCMVAIMVLSSSAAATTAAEIERDNMESVRDSNLDRADRILSGDYYETTTYPTPATQPPTQHTTPYFDDEPIVYDSDRYEIERMQDDIADLQDKQMATDGYDTDYSDRITNGIYAIIIVFIIVFILYCVFGDFNDVPEPHTPAQPYIPDTPDTDTPAQPYDRIAAQAEIEKEWK